MTGLSTVEDWIDELHEGLLATKDNPDEWYVVTGEHVVDFSIKSAEMPDEVPDDPADDPAPRSGDVENAEGYYQIGTWGWSADAFADDFDFVGEVGFGPYDAIDRRVNGLLLVHESALSDDALEIANSESEEVATA